MARQNDERVGRKLRRSHGSVKTGFSDVSAKSWTGMHVDHRRLIVYKTRRSGPGARFRQCHNSVFAPVVNSDWCC